jgi:tetratricopeptide (TPR) repeat protein
VKKHLIVIFVFFSLIAAVFGAFAWYFDSSSIAQGNITFSEHIAPIVFEHCASCHRPEESAPFSLLTYDDTAQRAEQIVEVTQSGYMPPWLPKHGYGDFEGERGLTTKQIDLIQRWVALGAPEGSREKSSQKPSFVTGWQLGEPDMVLKMPEPYALRPDGADVFHNFVLPISVGSSRFVRAVELRPGNKQIVHHANMLVDATGAAQRLDRQEPGPGYSGMENLSVASRPSGHFLSWKVGTVPFDGYLEKSWQLDPGSDLVINMHMLPSGKTEEVRAEVGLHFSETPPTSPSLALIQLEADSHLDIPPGEKIFTVTDKFTLPVDVEVFAVYPHAHLLGKDLQGYAILPDGSQQWLIWIDDWDWNWQAVYRYQKPIPLPKGTALVMRYTYDNSVSNSRNPNSPPVRVVAGNQTEDEMAHLWVQVLPKNQLDLQVLNEAKARHQLGKYPKKREQRISLGKALAGQGRNAEAIQEFRYILQSSPENIAARYNLACVLSLEGQTRAAQDAFKNVLRIDSQHVESHNNLAILLYRAGRLEEAAQHYREALAIRPKFAIGHNNLGLALQRLGRLEEAATHYRRALELRPDLTVAAQRLQKIEQIQSQDQSNKP